MKVTQCERIIDYIDEFGAITQLEAIRDLGCFRLASRISDLKKKGHNIVSEMVAVKNRWGEKTYVASYRWGDDNAKNDRNENPTTVSNPETPTETDFKYFTAEQVRNMSQKEVKENYADIMKSMKLWN